MYVRGMQQTFIDKYCFLAGVAEEKVLCLDSDTRVLSGLREAFDLLERFEVACAHAPFRFAEDFGPDDPRLPAIPAAFPELNAGVIFCRNTAQGPAGAAHLPPDARRVGVRGRAYIGPTGAAMCPLEEPGFSDVLPPEYNARLCFPAFLSGEAKILHCRLDDPRTAVRMVNASLEPRTFQPQEFGE